MCLVEIFLFSIVYLHNIKQKVKKLVYCLFFIFVNYFKKNLGIFTFLSYCLFSLTYLYNARQGAKVSLF